MRIRGNFVAVSGKLEPIPEEEYVVEISPQDLAKQLTAEEVKALAFSKLGGEKEQPSYDIKVLADESGILINPIYIGTEKITEIGIYEIYGIKWWITKADKSLPHPKERIEPLDFRYAINDYHPANIDDIKIKLNELIQAHNEGR